MSEDSGKKMETPVEPGSGSAFSLEALPFASKILRETFSLPSIWLQCKLIKIKTSLD